MDESLDPQHVRSVRRAAAILKAFTQEDTLLGVNELGRRLGLLPSTVYRLAQSLQAEGLLEQDPENGRYRLGLQMLRLGRLALGQRGFRDQALAWMKELARKTGEAVYLATLVDGQGLYLERVESIHMLRADVNVGATRPAHCTATGKMLLALMPEDELDRILRSQPLVRFTPHTLCTIPHLKEHLTQVRLQGYALDDEEQSLGVRCIGAPIWDYTGHAIAAIAVAGPAERLTLEQLLRIKDDVLRAAAGISSQLGWLRGASED